MNEMENIQPQEESVVEPEVEVNEEVVAEVVEVEQVEETEQAQVESEETTQAEQAVEVEQAAVESEQAAIEAEQSLEDATYDAGAHIEQSGSFEQSEQVEATLTTVVDEIVDAADQVSAQTSSLAQEVDPVTGESKPSGDASERETESGEAEEEILHVEPIENEVQMEAAVDQVTAEAEDTLPDDDATVDVVDLSEETPVADPEQTATPTNDEVATPRGEATHDVEAQRLGPETAPETRRMPVGMGKNGALFPAGAGVKTGGSMPAGGSSSGSGAPVDNPSGGTSKPKEGDGYHSGDSPSGRWLWVKSSKDNTPGVVKEPDGKGVWCMDKEGDWWYYELSSEEKANKKGDPVDGDFGTPYTGTTGGGEIPDPKEPEGPDREASFLQMVHASQDAESNQVGYGSSGDSTFSPDGGGEGDDSGRFYGGLEGSAVRPNNPDDPDYYTPNVLSEALAKMDMK